MKKIILLSILLFPSFLWAAETKGPQIIIKEPIAEYKDVIEGKDLIHTFKLKNSGDQFLKIKNVKAGG